MGRGRECEDTYDPCKNAHQKVTSDGETGCPVLRSLTGGHMDRVVMAGDVGVMLDTMDSTHRS